jgi:AcrR family transcriptional regulator
VAKPRERDQPSERILRKRELRAELIATRALEIVEREGIDALTLQRVGDALDCVAAGVYRYFASKDALVADLQRRSLAEVQEALRAAAEDAGQAEGPRVVPLRSLLRTSHAYLRLPTTHPRAWSLVSVLLGDPRSLVSDEQSARTAPLVLAIVAQVVGLFEAAVAAGALSEGDTLERALGLWSALHGALVLGKARRVAPSLPTAEHIGLGNVHALLLGWGADPRTLTRASAPPGHASKRRK